MAVKNKSQKKHAKALARKGKKPKASHQKDSFAFLEHHPSVQKRNAAGGVKKPVYTAPSMIAEHHFTIASTFPQKHPDVMELLDSIQERNVEADETGLYPCYQLDEDESEQVAQMVRSTWSISNEDLAIVQRPQDTTNPELMSFESLISFLLEDLWAPDQLSCGWQETSLFGFAHSIGLFERFIEQDWACKLVEYALVEKKMTYDIHSERFTPNEIEVQWVMCPPKS